MKNYETVLGKNIATTPIFHGGDEKTGSSPTLRTIMIWTEDGEVPLPYVHGNAVRGKLRRMIMKDMLDMLGYEITNKKLYHALFAGGALESTEDNTGIIDLEFRKNIVDLFPPISLFGCTFGNQMIAGKLAVGHMFPICREYAPYLPDQFKDDPRTKEPVRTFTDSSFMTRRDDLREEREKDEQAVQMKVDYECFVIGTAFYHEFKLMFTNDVEKSAFARMIKLWKEYPVIGGKGATGDGRIQLGYELEWTDDRYLDFVFDKKEEMKSMLSNLEEML